jgi:hypothetical protein
MDNSRKKQQLADWSRGSGDVPSGDTGAIEATAERRRVGKIVHDDRGNARVDWLDAPSDYKRQVFEIQEEPAGSLSLEKPKRSFNPYERATLPEPRKSSAPRKDLKKLSEWIKMMRDLEERKRKEEAD